MRIGVSMWSFHRSAKRGGMSVTDFVRAADDLGANDIEMLNVFWQEKESEVRAVSDLVDDLGLSVSAYDVGNDFAQADPSAYERALNEVRRGVDVANVLGAPCVRVFGGEPKEGISRDSALRLIIRGLSEGSDYAGERGVKLALENHGELYGTASQLLDIMRGVGSPNLGLNFDVGNFVIAGDDANVAIDRVFRHVLHIHMKDFRLASREEGETFVAADSMPYVPVGPGEGKTDVRRFMRKLKAMRYGGVVSVENESAGDELANTKRHINALRGMISQE